MHPDGCFALIPALLSGTCVVELSKDIDTFAAVFARNEVKFLAHYIHDPYYVSTAHKKGRKETKKHDFEPARHSRPDSFVFSNKGGHRFDPSVLSFILARPLRYPLNPSILLNSIPYIHSIFPIPKRIYT